MVTSGSAESLRPLNDPLYAPLNDEQLAMQAEFDAIVAEERAKRLEKERARREKTRQRQEKRAADREAAARAKEAADAAGEPVESEQQLGVEDDFEFDRSDGMEDIVSAPDPRPAGTNVKQEYF